jgi:hypothetical protein
MMKNAALIIITAIGLLAAIAFWFRDKDAVTTSAARPWPEGMGTLDAAHENWPPQKANPASVKLTALAETLPKDEVIGDFVAREIARGEIAIGEPPVLPDVSAIRALLLREPIIWERYDEVGAQKAIELRGRQMPLARALVAHALAQARANDPTAWDNLHAVWKLARSLDNHPQMMQQTAALAMARMINAVAWKMPLPAPAWFGELQPHDHVRQLLEAFQFQTASYWNDTWLFPTKWFANSLERDRQLAQDLANNTRCDVQPRINEVGTDLTPFWRRAFRYRAEREATANALRVRAGKPIETGSRCSDGGWTFDGTTLRFSREIATTEPDSPMPLVLQVKPANESAPLSKRPQEK